MHRWSFDQHSLYFDDSNPFCHHSSSPFLVKLVRRHYLLNCLKRLSCNSTCENQIFLKKKILSSLLRILRFYFSIKALSRRTASLRYPNPSHKTSEHFQGHQSQLLLLKATSASSKIAVVKSVTSV